MMLMDSIVVYKKYGIGLRVKDDQILGNYWVSSGLCYHIARLTEVTSTIKVVNPNFGYYFEFRQCKIYNQLISNDFEKLKQNCQVENKQF